MDKTLNKTITINGKSVLFTTHIYDGDTTAGFDRLDALAANETFLATFEKQPFTPFVLYDEKTQYEYHIQRTAEDKALVLDCFINHMMPYGDIEAIIIGENDTRELHKDDDGINYTELMDAVVSNKPFLSVREQTCGCIHCLKIFKSSEIAEYTTEPNGSKTAICPYCGMDGVLGEAVSPVPITEEFLKKFGLYN